MGAGSATTKPAWRRVTRGQRCPICEHADWCLIAPGGDAVICMRVPSARPVDCKGAGTGYLHRLTDQLPVKPPPRREPPPPPDMRVLAEHYADMANGGAAANLARLIGVSDHSLRRLDVGWVPFKRAWSFPMRDAEGRIVGIRLRGENGDKWAVRGSKQGLFLPDGMVGDLCEQVCICEGPTDTAAALDLGAYAIGRPSCQGREEWIVTLCQGRDVVIVADYDQPKVAPDGRELRPGQDGALKLARMLRGRTRWTKLLLPLNGKDLRQWRAQGCTSAVLQSVIRNTATWRP